MRKCCCDLTLYPLVEFPIQNSLELLYILDYYPKVNNLAELKQKIICDFLTIVNKLECGIQPDLEFLLLEISFIYIYDRAILFE